MAAMCRMSVTVFLAGVLLAVDAQNSYGGGGEDVHVDKPDNDKCECEA